MTTPTDLNELEHRAYRTLWQDGLLDLFVGIAIVCIGTSWVAGSPVLGAVVPALLVPLWQATRKRLVEPRVGYVEFSSERKGRERRSLGALLLLGVLMLVLGVAVYFVTRTDPSHLAHLAPAVIPALPAALMALGGVLVALLFGIRRFPGLLGPTPHRRVRRGSCASRTRLALPGTGRNDPSHRRLTPSLLSEAEPTGRDRKPPVSTAASDRSPLPAADEIDRLIHEPARLLLVSCLYVVEAADFVFLSPPDRLDRRQPLLPHDQARRRRLRAYSQIVRR